ELGAILLGMTTMSMTYFIAYCFAPTLIYNILMYLIFQKVFKKVFLES
ncbi:MAG: cell shape-determining protein MreD, partial [Streptococcus gallolyticus]|nr:cell shape-determining protein MreD [Streptococcus gallolyticus]